MCHFDPKVWIFRFHLISLHFHLGNPKSTRQWNWSCLNPQKVVFIWATLKVPGKWNWSCLNPQKVVANVSPLCMLSGGRLSTDLPLKCERNWWLSRLPFLEVWLGIGSNISWTICTAMVVEQGLGWVHLSSPINFLLDQFCFPQFAKYR